MMGLPMSRNLLKAGFDLTVWNRTIARAEPLQADGAKLAASAPDAVRGADVVITMLSDGFASGALVDDPEVQAVLSENAIWIDMSSTKPEHARAQSATLAKLGRRHLDAPVSGGTKGAEAASLAIMVGGERNVFNAAQPWLANTGEAIAIAWMICTWAALVTAAIAATRYWTVHRPRLEKGRSDLQVAMFRELQRQISDLRSGRDAQ